MNEDVERGERAELNDAELAGVSGGRGVDPGDIAERICLQCTLGGHYACDGGSVQALTDCIIKNSGVNSVQDCPYARFTPGR